MGRDSTLENAMSQCQAFGLSLPEAAAAGRADHPGGGHVAQHFASCGVTVGDIAQLGEIDGEELLRQRRTFSWPSTTQPQAKDAARAF